MNVAQQVWETFVLKHCLFNMEIISQALRANAHARRNMTSKDAYLAFLMARRSRQMLRAARRLAACGAGCCPQRRPTG